MRNKRTAYFLSSLLVAFAMSAVGSVQNFQPLEESFPSIGNIGSDCSNPWKTEYDALSRPIKSIRPSGAEEQTGYNALGYRTSFTNAEGKVISFGLDAQGRVTAITNVIGNVTRYTYDNNGNVIDREDAKNQSTEYLYDEMNRLTNVVHESVWKASFEYDLNGNNVAQASPLASLSLDYDSMNRLVSSLISVHSRSFAVTNSYDLSGNRTNIVYPDGLVVGYEYDEENRIKSVSTDYADQFSFNYDGASRLTNIAYPNGINSSFEYDAESRVTSFSHNNGSNFVQRSITRDPRGFKTSDDIVQGLEPAFIEGEQRRTHNAADQLTHIDQRDTWLGSQLEQWYNRDYTYNDNGCLTLERVDRNLWNTNSAIDEYTVDYEWDHDNRLTGTEKTVLVPHDEIDGMTGAVMNRTYTAGPSTSTEYLYDASGVRIARIHNSVTNHFVIDYNAPLKMPLAETDASGNITRYYIWSSHGLLAHMDVNPANGAITSTRYYHSDEQSSTLALTDEIGAVTDQFAYTPYGVATHTGSSDTPYTWLGGIAVRAEGNGLYYMLNRTYSAPMRRFISSDPSGIDGGVNLYAYANLAPTHFTDPFGLCADTSEMGFIEAYKFVKSQGEEYGWPYAHVLMNAIYTQNYSSESAAVLSVGKEILDFGGGALANFFGENPPQRLKDMRDSAFQSIDWEMNAIGRQIPDGTTPLEWADPYKNTPEGESGIFGYGDHSFMEEVGF